MAQGERAGRPGASRAMARSSTGTTVSSRMRNAYIDQQTFRGRYESMLTQYSLMQTQVEELKSELAKYRGQPAAAKALNAAQLTIRELRHALAGSEEQAQESSAAREQARRLREMVDKAEGDRAAMSAQLKRHEGVEEATAEELAGCRSKLQEASEELASKSKALETVKARVAGLVAEAGECKRLSAHNAWLLQQALKKRRDLARRWRLRRAVAEWALLFARERDLNARRVLEDRRRRRLLSTLCAYWREQTAERYHEQGVLSALAAKLRRGRLRVAFEALVDVRRVDATLNRHAKMDGLRRWSVVVSAALRARSRAQVCAT